MAYEDLRELFHNPSCDEVATYSARFEDPHTIRLNIDISGSPAFIAMVPEVYEPIVSASKLDKEISLLEQQLPGQAFISYSESCLIDEIVLTNDIEGVNPTRREIGNVLERLKSNDRQGHFAGIVQKYLMLQDGREVPLETCEDIRSLYDDLVLEEVIASEPNHMPDGVLFRKGTVHVYDRTGTAIHDGLATEPKIVSALSIALAFLHQADILLLVRIAAFHFLFGYIHPFYDGNGRMNRFISSYMLSKEYEHIAALGLSYSVKKNIEKYYKAYSSCEHILNKGDLTPFVIAFSGIVIEAMRSLRNNLVERKQQFDHYCGLILPRVSKESLDIAQALVTASLFAVDGITSRQIVDSFGISRQTAYKRMEPLKSMGALVTEKVGRQTYYRLDLKALDTSVNAAE